MASGQAEELTPHQGKVLFFPGGVFADGKTILVTSNQKGGYQNVALLDVATKQLKWITDTQWEAQAGEFSPDGTLATWVLNADGISTANLYDVSSGKSRPIDMPVGLTSPDGTPNRVFSRWQVCCCSIIRVHSGHPTSGSTTWRRISRASSPIRQWPA